MSKLNLIGIVLDEHQGDAEGLSFSKRPFYALRKDYFSAVSALGGVPIGIGYDDAAFHAVLDHCNGWIIPGGDHRFKKDWYDKAPPERLLKPSLRADFEERAYKAIIATDKPFLGVCNGMQVMAACEGGRLDYMGPDEQGETAHAGNPSGFADDHGLVVDEASKLFAITGSASVTINSSHRERVISVGDRVMVSGRSNDGVIEAIELKDHPFAIGVQWHPEIEPDSFGGRLIKAFVSASAKMGDET